MRFRQLFRRTKKVAENDSPYRYTEEDIDRAIDEVMGQFKNPHLHRRTIVMLASALLASRHFSHPNKFVPLGIEEVSADAAT